MITGGGDRGGRTREEERKETGKERVLSRDNINQANPTIWAFETAIGGDEMTVHRHPIDERRINMA